MDKHQSSVESFLSTKSYKACHEKHGRGGDLFIKPGFARWINVFFFWTGNREICHACDFEGGNIAEIPCEGSTKTS